MAHMILIMLCFFPFLAFAQNGIDAYVPPPMFAPSNVPDLIADTYPPLPPKRPDKLKVSKKYAAHMRKYGKAPETPSPERSSRPPSKSFSPRTYSVLDNLIEPTAEDILKQINPQ